MLPFFGKNFSNTSETIENALIIFLQNEIGLYIPQRKTDYNINLLGGVKAKASLLSTQKHS